MDCAPADTYLTLIYNIEFGAAQLSPLDLEYDTRKLATNYLPAATASAKIAVTARMQKTGSGAVRHIIRFAKARSVILIIALVICALMLISALALGNANTISNDYGLITGATISQHEECEPGEVWVPSPTNPIAGECVAQ